MANETKVVLSFQGRGLFLENLVSQEKVVMDYRDNYDKKVLSERLGVPYKDFNGEIVTNPNIQYADPRVEVYSATTFYTIAVRANGGTEKGKILRFEAENLGIDLAAAIRRGRKIAKTLDLEFDKEGAKKLIQLRRSSQKLLKETA
jgi:hypothetical protein